MAQRIHDHKVRVRDQDGRAWRATTWAEERSDGTWSGWLEFRPVGEDAASTDVPLCTGQETSQPNRRHVEYWASGLEPVYLEGALKRAVERSCATARGRTNRDIGPATAR